MIAADIREEEALRMWINSLDLIINLGARSAYVHASLLTLQCVSFSSATQSQRQQIGLHFQ